MSEGTGRIAVITEPRSIEIRTVPLPEVGEGEGLLEIETNGICGSDVEFFSGGLSDNYPMPMVFGHEPVGRVAALGPGASERFGVKVGDRVVVNSAIRCGHCADCQAGRDCRSKSYGTLSPDLEPGLWGGVATHLFLPPGATLIPLDESVSTEAAGFHNPLANGFEWAGVAGQVDESSRVTILGAGPRGIACALVAVHLGAEYVQIVGLERDRSRLELAEKLGAHSSMVLSGPDVNELRDRSTVKSNVIIDTTPGAVSAVLQAIAAVADGGRVVMAGIKGDGRAIKLSVDTIVRRRLTLTGPLSKTEKSLRQAVEALESGRMPLEHLTAKGFPLDEAAAALAELTSDDPERPISVRVDPRS